MTSQDAVTLNDRKTTKKRYRQIQPWLDFAYLPANSADDFRRALVERFGGYHPGVPSVLSAKANLRLGAKKLGSVMAAASVIRELLERVPAMAIPDDESSGPLTEAAAEQVEFSVEFMASVDDAGMLHFAADPLYAGFMDAVRNTEIRRWRRCEVCGRVFYALRLKQAGKANTRTCGRRCGQTARMRAWRARQAEYEQQRKYKRAGVKPSAKGETR